MSHSQFHSIKEFILRHAWLNLWDKHMTTGRINQVAFFMPSTICASLNTGGDTRSQWAGAVSRGEHGGGLHPNVAPRSNDGVPSMPMCTILLRFPSFSRALACARTWQASLAKESSSCKECNCSRSSRSHCWNKLHDTLPIALCIRLHIVYIYKLHIMVDMAWA